MNTNFFSYWQRDLPASVVVFFVALPLCLGIALASGAPLFSGLIAGIVGGIIVGLLSGSQIGVSGPAAGLAAIVVVAIGDLGGYQNFLVAVVIGGLIQIGFGIAKAGVIGYYFPASVIKGMLTGIGIFIILKQIEFFFGIEKTAEGDWAFMQGDGETIFSHMMGIFDHINYGATLIAFISLGILILWSSVLSKQGKFFQLVQGPLVAVVVGIIFYRLTKDSETLGITAEHLVNVPVPEDFSSFLGQFSSPNWAVIKDYNVWITGFTIALVASLETLLCVEATDKLDPGKRVTPTNRELLAQGTGNMVSGFIGGLPITQVIVRSSANVQSGGYSKLSAVFHGFLLVGSVLFIPVLLNQIPLSVLAAVLMIVGYKLAKPSTFKSIYNSGWKQFIPFIVTVLGIIFTNLLLGIALGLAVAVVIILYKSYQNSHFLHIEDKSSDRHTIRMTLAEEVTFFNKAAILRELDLLEEGTLLELDVRATRYLDYDVIEILEDYAVKAKERGIDISIIADYGNVVNPDSYIDFFEKARIKAANVEANRESKVPQKAD
ncbi:MAG: SulP family inorganic anion transporter [Bacteroidota bacterium]